MISKYRNIKTVIDGITFDSKKEAKRYQELMILKQSGDVEEFIRQPEYILQDGFVNPWTGKKEREIKYRADFLVKYKDQDHWIVEDVKGMGKSNRFTTRTSDFNLKRKMFILKYPDLEFRLV